ncbi:MAG TPA: PIN domain-containing protein [Thermoanaerobaculia bacterium]|nr:PIN domain-containing protein [Thermoanaerobaculia bacterium]
MHAVLIDAGPLVALLDRSDDHHDEVVAALSRIRDRLVSVWPVAVEAMYLLAFSWQAQKALWEIFETGAVELLPLHDDDIPHLKRLMEKYRDLPMDMADAALVRVAGREGIRRVLTLDRRDFSAYRLERKGSFTLLP